MNACTVRVGVIQKVVSLARLGIQPKFLKKNQKDNLVRTGIIEGKKMHDWLFPQNPRHNILPYDGEAYYFGKLFSGSQTQTYFQTLYETIDWARDELVLYGKKITTKRKVAWYGDSKFEYSYSGSKKLANQWTSTLLELKEIVEKVASDSFNSCLLNLYHSGEEGMSWHSDDEDSLLKNGKIFSLSFGAERRFLFRHKLKKETIAIDLEDGSGLSMEGNTQANWLHSLPKTTKIKMPRINLTFRTFLK